MSSAGRVLVFGSANADHVLRMPRFPQPGETLMADSYALELGGKGANQAFAAAASGAATEFGGAVGEDAVAGEFVAAFADARIATRHLAQVPGPTGAAFIQVAPNGENHISVIAGANAQVSPAAVAAAVTASAEETRHLVVLLSLEIPLAAVEAAAVACRRAGGIAVVNAAPFQPLPQALLEATDVLVVNEHEAELLVRQHEQLPEFEDDRTLAAWQRLMPQLQTIVTLGARGATVLAAGREEHFPAQFRPEVVSSVGAGDAFCGALAAAVAQGAELPEAVEAANLAGALSVGVSGSRTDAELLAPVRVRLAARRASDAESP